MADALATIAADKRSGIEDFEQIERNERDPKYHGRGRGFGTSVSVSLTHAKVAREKKPQPQPTAPKPAPVAAPAIVSPPPVELAGRVLAIFGDYTGLQTAVRNRVDECGITREQLDHLSGNQPGYSGKILGRKQVKKFGKQSLGNTLGVLGCYLALVDDPEQVENLVTKAIKHMIVADALSGLAAAATSALATAAQNGICREEFEQIAELITTPIGIGELGETLSSAGCKMALVENPEQTAKMMARAEKRKRKRPLRDLKLLPTADRSHART